LSFCFCDGRTSRIEYLLKSIFRSPTRKYGIRVAESRWRERHIQERWGSVLGQRETPGEMIRQRLDFPFDFSLKAGVPEAFINEFRSIAVFAGPIFGRRKATEYANCRTSVGRDKADRVHDLQLCDESGRQVAFGA